MTIRKASRSEPGLGQPEGDAPNVNTSESHLEACDTTGSLGATSRVAGVMRPDDALDRTITRRGLIGAGLGLAAGAMPTAAAYSATESAQNLPPAVPQWQKQPGAPVMTPPYGLPSPQEANVVRRPRPGAPSPTNLASLSNSPLQDLSGIVTPNGLHYERHHAGVPDIDSID